MAIDKIEAIVTDIVKYSDRHNIVTLFTRTRGRVSVLVSAGSGREARMRNAALMPMSVISSDINFDATRDIQRLGRFSRTRLWRDLYFNPIKSAVGMFICEFLNVYMRQSPPDPLLWDYAIRTIEKLDTSRRGVANLHIAFLVETLEITGIRPDLSGWSPESWLDMRGGVMSTNYPGHRDVIAPVDGRAIPTLARMNLRNAHLYRFTAAERREILSALLHYFSIHFPGLSDLKSPAVLSEVFS